MRSRRRSVALHNSQNGALDLLLLHARNFLGHGRLKRVNHARGRLDAKPRVFAFELKPARGCGRDATQRSNVAGGEAREAYLEWKRYAGSSSLLACAESVS
jgi:hypothetical protein